jgi:hypothetical protein
MNGLLLRGHDDNICRQAARQKLSVTIDAGLFSLPFEKTLVVEPETRVPWDLLPAAWQFLERWDAAVPLWKYHILAQDAGSPSERQITREIVRDLRVMLHSCELLFVRRNETGQALMDTWQAELGRGEDKRLAFLRAIYQVKPRLCVLPVTWLANVRQESYQPASRARPKPVGVRLVQVELAPGRIVKVREGDEARVKKRFEEQQAQLGRRLP